MKLLLFLLLITITMTLVKAKDMSCGQSYDECKQDTQVKDTGGQKFASVYNWITGGRYVCDDTFKLCVYFNEKANPKI
jgi:hypothetical protein